MPVRYSLVHLTHAACPPPEMIYTAAEAGYDCVSFRGIPTRMGPGALESHSVKESITGKMPYDFAGQPQLIKDTLKAAAETGIVIHDCENARIFDGVDVRNYKRDLDAMAQLGVRHVLTNIWTDNKVFYTEQFSLLCELAGELAISVNLEFVTWAGVKTMQAAKELLLASGRDNAGIVVDTLHFHRSGVKIEEFDDMPGSWFRYVHLCDCEAEIPTDTPSLIRTGLEERLFPGEGAADIRGVVNKVPHAVRGIEVPNPKRMGQMGFEAYIRSALVATKQFLGADA